ncbi:MAG: hypothetical protein OEW04_03335, partial [Nitrospirota bacterium]|nr:hypothetical protein [Nitrospirota bacterium]
MRRLVVVLVSLLAFSGCQAKSSFLKSPLENEGEVYLYHDPFPQSADRLSFWVEELSAVKEDGSVFPLSLALEDFNGAELRRQRFVASGRLPAGVYSGFLCKVKRAELKTEEGTAELLVSGEPSKIDFSFSVEKRKAVAIAMAFKYGESLQGGVSFSPVFALRILERPLTGLTGYLSNYGSDTITIFDKKKHQVAGVIATGAGPAGISLDRRLSKAYVALSEDDAVGVLDVAS